MQKITRAHKERGIARARVRRTRTHCGCTFQFSISETGLTSRFFFSVAMGTLRTDSVNRPLPLCCIIKKIVCALEVHTHTMPPTWVPAADSLSPRPGQIGMRMLTCSPCPVRYGPQRPPLLTCSDHTCKVRLPTRWPIRGGSLCGLRGVDNALHDARERRIVPATSRCAVPPQETAMGR